MQDKAIPAAIFGCLLIGSVLPVAFADAVRGTSHIALAEVKAKGVAVELDKLPKAVVDAVKTELPGARLTKAMKLSDGNYWLTDVKVGKKEYNVTVTPEGKVLKREEDKD